MRRHSPESSGFAKPTLTSYSRTLIRPCNCITAFRINMLDMYHVRRSRIRPMARWLSGTVSGDAIWHRGGNAWLGSVVALVGPLGVNERAVRTAVFRLAQDHWLASQQIGRRSYYRLTEIGRRRVDAAHGR